MPLSVTLCGLLLALSVIFNVADSGPEITGVKDTLMVQVPPPGTLDPQSLVWLKLSGLVPPNEILLMFSGTPWLLLRITCWLGLSVPTDCVPNVRLVGETVAMPQLGMLKVEIRVCQSGVDVV